MAKLSPTNLFTGYEELAPAGSATAASIAIPKAAIPALSEDEADPATGNAMEIVRAILNKAYVTISNLPNDERPTKASIVRQDIKFLPNGNYERTYIVKFELQFSDDAAIGASE